MSKICSHSNWALPDVRTDQYSSIQVKISGLHEIATTNAPRRSLLHVSIMSNLIHPSLLVELGAKVEYEVEQLFDIRTIQFYFQHKRSVTTFN